MIDKTNLFLHLHNFNENLYNYWLISKPFYPHNFKKNYIIISNSINFYADPVNKEQITFFYDDDHEQIIKI